MIDDDEADRLSADVHVILALCIRAHERPHEPQHLASARYLQGRWMLDAERYGAQLRRAPREPRQGKP